MIKLLLTIHILGVAIFIGNIFATLVWKIYAEKSRNLSVICHTLETALKSDKTITIPSVIAITLSGILLLYVEKIYIFDFSWLIISILLWILSAIGAIFYLIPLLKKLSAIANSQTQNDNLSINYYEMSKRWNIASAILIVSPFVILVLMVVKLPS